MRRVIQQYGLAFTVLACFVFGSVQAADSTAAAEKAATDVKDKVMADVEAVEAVAKELEARETAINAYIYAYPLITMEMTRRVLTNAVRPEGTRAPMGQFVRMREYPNASFKAVTAPNADTLYTTTWLDVSKEPWIVSIPDMKGRYYLFPMLDGWTNVFQDPGKRTTGTGAQQYAITGPGWSGPLPTGVTEYKSPTGMVWVLGRIYCTGTPEDYRGGACPAGSGVGGAAFRLREAVHPAGRQGRSSHRHEDGGPGTGQRPGCRLLFQTVHRTAEDQSPGTR